MDDLRPEALSWTALLGRWIEYAQASLAIPETEEGDRWRASVPSVITLQAVTFALGELAELPRPDRPVARDRAAILIADGAATLDEVWRGAAMSEELLTIAADARAALEASRYAGAHALVWPGPETMVMPFVDIADAVGTLAVMQPGTIVMPGEPVAWWCDRAAVEIDGCIAESIEGWPPQVYRQMDDEGRITSDVVAPLHADLPPGFPLLVPLLDDGHPVGDFTLEADVWLATQREAMPEAGVEVVHVDG